MKTLPEAAAALPSNACPKGARSATTRDVAERDAAGHDAAEREPPSEIEAPGGPGGTEADDPVARIVELIDTALVLCHRSQLRFGAYLLRVAREEFAPTPEDDRPGGFKPLP